MSNNKDFIELQSPNLEKHVKQHFRLAYDSKHAELDDEDLAQLDNIDNAVFDMINRVATTPVDWDMALIGPIADFAVAQLNNAGYKTNYPGFIEHADGTVEYAT